MDAQRQHDAAPSFDWFDALDDFNRRKDVRPQTKRAFERIWRWARGKAGELKGFSIAELANYLACDPRTARETFEELLQTYTRKGVEHDGLWLVDVILNEGGVMRLYVYDPRTDIQERRREPDPQQVLPGFDHAGSDAGNPAQESPSPPQLRVFSAGNLVQESPPAPQSGEERSGISAQESPPKSSNSAPHTYTSFNKYQYQEPPPTNASASQDWKEAEEVLRATGMGDWRGALQFAFEARVPVAEVLALVAYWHEHRPAWDVGALYRRIQNHAPGQPVGIGWPVKSDAYLHAKRRDYARQIAATQAQERAERQAQAEAERAEQTRLETRYGAWLDTRPRERVLELVRSACPFLLPSVNTKGLSAIAREAVLSYLAQHPREAEGPD